MVRLRRSRHDRARRAARRAGPRSTTALGPHEPTRTAAWARVRDEVAAGHRAYVVCPLVEGSERVEARSATEEYERLADGVLAGLRSACCTAS